MSKVWLYTGDSKTFALYSAEDLADAVKFSLRHRNKKMIQVAATRSVTSLVAAEDAPEALDEFLTRSVDIANDYIDMNEPLTNQILISMGAIALIGYGLFSVGAHFGLMWAIVALPLAIVALALACLSLMILAAILWGAISFFSPEISREIFSDLKTVLNGTDKRNA
jgi:hypothetical protein